MSRKQRNPYASIEDLVRAANTADVLFGTLTAEVLIEVTDFARRRVRAASLEGRGTLTVVAMLIAATYLEIETGLMSAAGDDPELTIAAEDVLDALPALMTLLHTRAYVKDSGAEVPEIFRDAFKDQL